jgi:magnesium-transporting ATPase (P-type)
MKAVPKKDLAEQVGGSELAETISDEETLFGNVGIYVILIGLSLLCAFLISCFSKESAKYPGIRKKLRQFKRKIFWNTLIRSGMTAYNNLAFAAFVGISS